MPVDKIDPKAARALIEGLQPDPRPNLMDTFPTEKQRRAAASPNCQTQTKENKHVSD